MAPSARRSRGAAAALPLPGPLPLLLLLLLLLGPQPRPARAAWPAADPAASCGCGGGGAAPAAAPGTTAWTDDADGRTFLLYSPPGLPAGAPAPLVVGTHCFGCSAAWYASNR